MSTYIPSSNNQRDSVPMLYLREPLQNSYNSEAPVLPGNIMTYMNFSSSSGSFSDTLPVGNSHSDSNVSHQEFLSSIGGESGIGENDFSAWRDSRSEMMLMNPMGGQGQGLSLSLSPNIPSGIQFQSIQYRNPNLGVSSFLSPNSSISVDENCQSKSDVSPYGIPSISRTISDSKYLKAAQQLLDDVVNVSKALKQRNTSKKELMKDLKEVDGESQNATSSNPQESTVNSASELSAAEKQDLQNKMTKLSSMLDEVDRRYKQYYHQMQIVVSSFDMIAGCGSAKPYTALALQTISCHFRCLRDAINGQIKVTQKSLGEPDNSTNGNGVGISRLRYVDQQLRQQRALQQLGMMQQHTWRPQRGLPESSVSILRAWLFEHFLHPYPKDSDKIMLARQTGLTRSQVSNWFINARVRLWKPMVEEMYKEEAEDAEMDQSNSSSENIAPKSTKGDIKTTGDRVDDIQQSAASTATEQCSTGQFFESKSNHAHDIEMAGTSTHSDFQNMAHVEQRPNVDDCNLFTNTMVQPNAGENERFMAEYHMSDFQNVSLTLGLQHCEDGSLPMSHHSFVNMRGDDVYNAGNSLVGPETVDFDCMDLGNRQQRFGSSHLLHDFVA